MLIFPHAFADNIKQQFSSFRKVENRFIWHIFGWDQDCKRCTDLLRILWKELNIQSVLSSNLSQHVV